MKTQKPYKKNQIFPRYLKNHQNFKSSEKSQINAVGYSENQRLEKNIKKNFGRMREILGAHRKKPITLKSVLWNFEISISDGCIILLVTWPLVINNPFQNRFINGFITAILKKLTFPQNPIISRKTFDGSVFRPKLKKFRIWVIQTFL